MHLSIGIDIGTTSLCAVVLDIRNRTVLKAITVPNGTDIPGEYPWQRCQQPDVIVEKCKTILDQLLGEFGPVQTIGVTGQMHGILYYDAEGRAVSKLYTWQDESGNQLHESSKKWAQFLSEESGYPLASGFGCVTHACNTAASLVPKEAVGFCTVHDYLVMTLTGRKTPLCHATDAASFGLYDLENQCFDLTAAAKVGIDPAMLPETTDDRMQAGTYRGIGVYTAIGDNQASFLGAVKDVRKGVLLNIGTGSQVSVMVDAPVKAENAEIRPFLKGSYLMVGASLCGGRAYAALERFLRSFAEAAGFGGEQYDLMGRLAQSAMAMPEEEKLRVDTRFCGTRRDSLIRGSVENLSLENLTPAHLICGFLEGTVEELYDFYREAIPMVQGREMVLIGSGNGLRKNLLWQQIAQQRFAMPLEMSDVPEEAACGAAIFGAGAYM